MSYAALYLILSLYSFCVYTMTEFKRTIEELASLEELLGSLADDSSTPAPERFVAFSAAKVKPL